MPIVGKCLGRCLAHRRVACVTDKKLLVATSPVPRTESQAVERRQ